MMTALSSRRQFAFASAAISVLLLMIIRISFVTGETQYGSLMVEPRSSTLMDAGNTSLNSIKLSVPNRKLLQYDVSPAAAPVEHPDRSWGEKCSKSDIVITQGPTAPLPSGIPTYTVEIMNVCPTGCDISGIHVTCGWFSSARLINPHLFKRLSYNDCLVNDGKPLMNGRTISFQYANTFPYQLAVSSVVC